MIPIKKLNTKTKLTEYIEQKQDYKFSEWQKKLLLSQEINKREIVLTSRRTGKTSYVINSSIIDSISLDDYESLIIVPYSGLTNNLMNEVLNTINLLGFEDLIERSSVGEIVFKNNSRIRIVTNKDC